MDKRRRCNPSELVSREEERERDGERKKEREMKNEGLARQW